MKLKNYILGKWVEGEGAGTPLFNAVTGEKIAEATTKGIDFKAALEYGRRVGSPNLRKMTFHQRARMLKALALYLNEKKDIFYQLSYATGATKADSWVDIEGGIGNLFVYASKGRRELPDEPFYVDGKPEMISKQGTFIGQHICVPLEGVAVHINAFNFPCWGMLEKIAVNFLAGVPAIVKPATVTSFLTELMVREIIASKILPEGALQLLCGSVGDLLEHVTCQDVVTFTGSAETGKKLKTMKSIIDNSVRFNMEADSLNCSILGTDASPDSEIFKLFIKEVSREMTLKSGQRCTAIRRAIVPEHLVQPVIDALASRLKTATLGNPQVEGVRMGPLVSKEQVSDVKSKVKQLMTACELAYGDPENFEVVGADKEHGAFLASLLLYCNNPFNAKQPHEIEAFGPVSTVMPYGTLDDACKLAKMGRGSLCGSVFTNDDRIAKEIVMGSACMHGRLMLINTTSAGESTGHGSPLAHLVHGGPGRAGGGEEMGGIRGIFHYMQRTALQGSPTTLTRIVDVYEPKAEQRLDTIHPFRKHFEELQIGDTLITGTHIVTLQNIEDFAELSGDKFYAHMDENSLEGTIFTERVAHGYYVLSRAAGLFVDPPKGPVLLNYGIEECRFTKPVYPGAVIGVRFTCKEKIDQEKRTPDDVAKGIVKWVVDVYDQTGDTVAIATILTMVKKKNQS